MRTGGYHIIKFTPFVIDSWPIVTVFCIWIKPICIHNCQQKCRTLGSSPSSRSYLPGLPRSLADGDPGGLPIPARLSGTGSVFPSQSAVVRNWVCFSESVRVQFLCLLGMPCSSMAEPAPMPLHRCPCTSPARITAALAYADPMARAIEKKRRVDRKGT